MSAVLSIGACLQALYSQFETPVGVRWASGLAHMDNVRKQHKDPIHAGVRLDLVHVDVSQLQACAVMCLSSLLRGITHY